MAWLFIIPWEKAGKGIPVGRQKGLGSDRSTSPGGWRRRLHGDKLKSKRACQAGTRKGLNFVIFAISPHLLLPSGITAQAVDFQLCFPRTLLGGGTGYDPAPRYTSGKPGQGASSPSSRLPAARGRQRALGEECHREDAFIRWFQSQALRLR